MSRKRRDRNLLFMVAAIVFMAAPATLATAYFLLSGDPSVRPLSASRESEAISQGRALGIEIVARVRWGRRSQAGFDRSELKQMITGAFYSHGAEVRTLFEDVPGTTITITYEVGENVFGPAPISRASQNVRAAVGAYRLSLHNYDP